MVDQVMAWRLWRALASRALAAAVPLLLLAAGCGRSQKWNGELVEPPQPIAPVSGVNWDGKPYTSSEHRGKVTMVFFGYTYCPDVCPFTLAKMKQLYAKLGDRAPQVEVVFVSVDPKRDTIDKLSRYVPSFDRRFYGLRLEPPALEAALKTFDATIQFGQPAGGPDTDTYYYVDHTGTFFVLDRDGKLRLKYPPSTTAEQMLPDLEKLLAT